MEDYRIRARVVNNRIIELMESHGIGSAAELARVLGYNNSTETVNLINMKISPINSKIGKVYGRWKPIAAKMADLFGVLPEEMFNEQQIYNPLETNKSESKISSAQLEWFLSEQKKVELPRPDESQEKEELSKVINLQLNSIPIRYRKVLEMRFGLNDNDFHTLEESAVKLDVTRERVRQMEAKALRMIRQPKRANAIKEAI